MQENNKLLEYRDKIDAIDGEIVRLLAERFDIAKEVAEYKKSNNLPIFQADREAEILRRISEQLSGENRRYREYILDLYKIILDKSKIVQKEENNS